MDKDLSQQLDGNTEHGKIRLYYQADLLISKYDFDNFVKHTMPAEELGKEQATKFCLEVLAEDVMVDHPYLKGVVSPKIFITEPMPTSDEYCL